MSILGPGPGRFGIAIRDRFREEFRRCLGACRVFVSQHEQISRTSLDELGFDPAHVVAHAQETVHHFTQLAARSAAPGAGSPVAEISDADIDNLVSE